MTLDQVTESALPIYIDYALGKYQKDKFWRMVIEHFNLTADKNIRAEELSKAYIDSYVFYDDVSALVKQLRETYQIGLLSNLTPEMREHIRAVHETKSLFHEEVYSCDPGVAILKPERGAYQAILSKLGKTADECLFIDDSQKNIDAAAELGMQTIIFKDKASVLKDLTTLL